MNKNTIEAVAAEKIYTFRPLEATDVFPMFKILGKIGINEFIDCFGKDAVQKMLNTVTGEGGVNNLQTMVGASVILEMVNVIINNLPKCEQEIYQLLSNTSNLSVDQVKKLGFATFFEMVIDFIRKDEFKDFIKVVSVLFK